MLLLLEITILLLLIYNTSPLHLFKGLLKDETTGQRMNETEKTVALFNVTALIWFKEYSLVGFIIFHIAQVKPEIEKISLCT